MIPRFIVLFFATIAIYLLVNQYSPESAQLFTFFIFGIVALYLLIRLPLEFWLHRVKEEEDEENEKLFNEVGEEDPGSRQNIFYNIRDYNRARQRRNAKRR